MPTPRRPIRATALAAITIALLTGLLTAGATAATSPRAAPRGAEAAPATELFVAPDGAGERCTRAEPCSLETAQQQVRTQTSDLTGDIVVNLLDGLYRRTEPWVMSAAKGDSGAGPHQVVYQAADYGTAQQAEPVISGGRDIDGWELVDPDRDLWRAPVADLRTRQLYVNDRRAIRARQEAPIPGEVTTTDEGYVTTDPAMRSWRNPGQVEMVWLNGANNGHFQWAEPRCKVDDIAATGDTTTITMAQPCYQRTTELRGGSGLTQPTSIENAFELLDSPGEWYLDEAEQNLYYMPREDEDLATARVVAPRLQTLLRGEGTERKPLRNVAIKGLTFADAGYLAPESDEGFSEDAYNMIYEPLAEDEEHNIFWSGFIKNVQMPANVTMKLTHDSLFEGNTFTRLGAAGLTLDNGSQRNVVRGNVFTDISGQGVQVGNVDVGADSGPLLTERNRVVNNYFTNIAAEYSGGYALYIAAAAYTTVSHNYMGDLPRGGIANNHVYIRGNSINHAQQITNNAILNWGKVILDGGGIDTHGLQRGPDGKQPGSTIAENVIAHGHRGFGQIYLDNWAMGFTVENNVAYDNSFRSSLLRIVQRDSPCCNTIQHNYWDKIPAWGHTDIAIDNPVLPQEAMPASVLNDAGPKQRWFPTIQRAARTTLLDELSLPVFSGDGEVAAPTDVQAGPIEPGPRAELSWSAGTGGDSITGYEVGCSSGAEPSTIMAAVPGDRTQTPIEGLRPGAELTCTVRARNADGAISEPSEPVRIAIPGAGEPVGHWGFDEQSGPVATDDSISANDADLWRLVERHEAEDGELEGGLFSYPMGAGVGQTSGEYYPAHTGTAAVSRYRPPNASVTHEVNVPENGTYTLDFRYSASREGTWDPDGSRTLSLYVNGERQQLRFPWTGSWASMSNLRTEVELDAGANTVALKAEEGDHGWIVYDHLNVLEPVTDRVTGPSGSALPLDGSVSANVGAEPVADFPTGSYSVTARFKADGDGSGRLVSKGFHNANAVGYALSLEDGALRFGVGSNWQTRLPAFPTRESWEKTLTATTARTDLADGSWHDVAVVVDTDRETVRLYVDGVPERLSTPDDECARATGTRVDISACTRIAAWSYDPLTIGSYDNTLEFATGAIDDVALYDRALGTKEVRNLTR